MATPGGAGCDISSEIDQLFIRCFNCDAVFPADMTMDRATFQTAVIPEVTYKCPTCAKYDSYGKEAMFYNEA